jgi:hypothetical protein
MQGAYDSDSAHDSAFMPPLVPPDAIEPADVGLFSPDNPALDAETLLPRPVIVLCYVMIALVHALCVIVVYLHSFNMTWPSIQAWIIAYSFAVGLEFFAMQPVFAAVSCFIRVYRMLVN